jgi:hypothetical protein
MPTNIYDSSQLTRRLQNKTIATNAYLAQTTGNLQSINSFNKTKDSSIMIERAEGAINTIRGQNIQTLDYGPQCDPKK